MNYKYNMGKPAYNRIDMTGKIYNSWKIVKYIETIGKITYWEAICTLCDRIYKVDGRNVRQQLSKCCVECGNIRSAKVRTGKPKTDRTAKETSEHYLYIKEKNSAINKRKLDWKLSKYEFLELIYGNCNYCGEPPSRLCNPVQWSGLAQKTSDAAWIIRNGIDRVDNLKGYIKDNSVPCCTKCNLMKTNSSLEDFKEHIKKIYLHLNKK